MRGVPGADQRNLLSRLARSTAGTSICHCGQFSTRDCARVVCGAGGIGDTQPYRRFICACDGIAIRHHHRRSACASAYERLAGATCVIVCDSWVCVILEYGMGHQSHCGRGQWFGSWGYSTMRVAFNALYLQEPHTGTGRYVTSLLSALGRVDGINEYLVLSPTEVKDVPET